MENVKLLESFLSVIYLVIVKIFVLILKIPVLVIKILSSAVVVLKDILSYTVKRIEDELLKVLDNGKSKA